MHFRDAGANALPSAVSGYTSFAPYRAQYNDPTENHVAQRSRRSFLRSSLCASVAALLVSAVSSAPAFADGQKVSVLYAGSLVNVMEHSIGPAFTKATGIPYEGYAGGSNKVANEIKGRLRRGDVFISASPKVNDTLSGTANGDWVKWYTNFAESPLVIGYNPSSRFAEDLRTRRWDVALQAPGLRLGRTDPKLDPKGRFTVNLVEHAAVFYNKPDLMERILGSLENPQQVLPEETLVGRLQSGQLDAGFFYSTETSDLKIPSIPLPEELKEKAQYTMTILNNAPNAAGADRFVAFLLGPQGQALLKSHGIELITPKLSGDAAAVPAAVRTLVGAN